MFVEALDGQLEWKGFIDEAFVLEDIEEFNLIDAFPYPTVAHRLDLRIFRLQLERLDETIAVRSIIEHVIAEIALDVSP